MIFITHIAIMKPQETSLKAISSGQDSNSPELNFPVKKGERFYMTVKISLSEKLETYVDSVRRAEKWLVSALNPDGTMNPAEKGPLSYYKVPRGLAIIGRLKEANSMLDWTKREIFTSEGDFRAERKAFHHYHYTYSSAWFVWVAQFLGRFDVSYKGMDYLRKFRNPETGGYCSEAPFSKDRHNEQDLLTISFTSFIGLYMGMLNEAIKAAELLSSIFEQQSDPGLMIWLRVDENGKLIRHVPDNCEERRFYALEVKAPLQYYYYLGAAMVFLTRLYAITGEKKHLELANTVHEVCLNCHEDVFLTDGTGKVGLGSAFLYQATGEKKYAESAMKSCDFLVSDQHPDGYWIRGGKPTASSTAEFVVWLWEVVSILKDL